MHPVDPAIFGVLVIFNLGLGAYFALFKTRNLWTRSELVLGSRSLAMLPLAVSTMASTYSGLGIVGFTAHFYLYGLHMLWFNVPMLLFMPFFANCVAPVLYDLKVTSIFEVRKSLVNFFAAPNEKEER